MLDDATTVKPVEGNKRRAKILSVIFHKHISSMMNSGEICPELLQLGFTVEQVLLY